jgi:hypothetical protein
MWPTAQAATTVAASPLFNTIVTLSTGSQHKSAALHRRRRTSEADRLKS